ncbi:Glutamyl-tRNA reductase [termite gut metagenome]|uniref:Glutamyl-tRNA reductase n=1 Tax=termite gut metagenome TaxID=433724 RepID=A0A5J4T1I1_9ZZZZ
MIHCKLINNANYTLKEREILLETTHIDRKEPHVLLQTCNRVEFYWGEGSISDSIIRHLYRVASGLESNLIGERAIQGQLKNAYQEACEKYKLSSQLNRLFQTAIHTGKRVRTETKISEGAVSHSQVTVDILKKEDIDFQQKIVGIIGVNKITEDILKFLTDNRTINVFLSNRNFEKAEELAKRYNGTAIRFDDKKRMLELTDILITATSAPHTIIKCDDISPGKEILIFDLAFPRDVETSLGEMEGVKLYDLEEIEQFAKNNLQLRNNEMEKAERIIEEEINKFHQWYSRLQCAKV